MIFISSFYNPLAEVKKAFKNSDWLFKLCVLSKSVMRQHFKFVCQLRLGLFSWPIM